MRVAPLVRADLDDMLDSLSATTLLGAFRGQQPLDRDALWRTIDAVAQTAIERSDIASIDINPVIITPQGEPIAVDALIELQASNQASEASTATPVFPRHADAGFRALFEPRGVVVLGRGPMPAASGMTR